MTTPASCLNLGPVNIFVSISSKFVSVPFFIICYVPTACASLYLWYTIEVCFLFNVYSGVVVLITIALLSQNKLVGSSIGKSIIQSLYIKSSISFTNCFIIINSEPNVDNSTVF